MRFLGIQNQTAKMPAVDLPQFRAWFTCRESECKAGRTRAFDATPTRINAMKRDCHGASTGSPEASSNSAKTSIE